MQKFLESKRIVLCVSRLEIPYILVVGQFWLSFSTPESSLSSRHMASGSWMDQVAIWRAGLRRTSSPYGDRIVVGPARHMASGHDFFGSKWFPLGDSDGWEVLVSPFPVSSFVSQELFVEEIGSSNSRTCRITSFKIIRDFLFREILFRDFQALIRSWLILTPTHTNNHY